MNSIKSMSHIFTIPCAFLYGSPEVRWRYHPMARVKGIESGTKAVRNEVPILVGERDHTKRTKLLSPVDLRDAFYSLEENVEDLLNFLNTWGAWEGYADPRTRQKAADNSARTGRQRFLADFYPYSKKYRIPHSDLDADYVVSPIHFWQMRQHLMEATLNPKSLESSFVLLLNSMEISSVMPFFRSSHVEGSSALEAQIVVDALNGVPFRKCAREDCGNIFVIGSHKEKIYCSTGKCAHLAAVRRSRVNKKKTEQELGLPVRKKGRPKRV